ncbi:hypothetical protein BH09BAC4_BH09BAC4_02390 [soil metagenome]
MKKAILTLITIWFSASVYVKAQVVVNGTNVNNLDIQYIKLIGYDKWSVHSKTSSEAMVWLDFGQGLDLRKSSEFLRPAEGNGQEPVHFKSVIEALNYLYRNGWELIQQYQPEPNSYQHYVLQRSAGSKQDR